MKFHLYKRNDTTKSSSWYLWYTDSYGKRIRKACTIDGKPCRLKRDAERFLAQFEKDYEEEQKKITSITIKDIAEDMFTEGSMYQKLRISHGHENKPQTIKLKKMLLNKYIIPEFGDCKPSEIEGCQIENWIIGLELSNASRINIMGVFREILNECQRNKIINSIPVMEKFIRNTQKKDILTNEEIQILFPDDYVKLSTVWENIRHDRYMGIDGKYHAYSFMFGVMFKLVLYTGLRIGEVAAICLDQVKEGCLLINKMIDHEKKLQFHLKKGNKNNTKARVAVLPSSMSDLLNYYLSIRPDSSVSYIFTFNGTFCKKEMLERRFKATLVRNGINLDGKRILTPHSLRYTYNSLLVHSQFPEQVLRSMIGHTSQEMTDYYTKQNVENQIKGLLPYQDMIDSIFNSK